MHGIIMVQLQRFVGERLGPTAWDALHQRAGLPRKLYVAVEANPDDDITRLVAAASEVSGTPVPALLEAFGEYLVPGLLGTYGAHLKPGWSMLDVILNTEETIHKVVRRQSAGATPPALRASRISASEVLVSYASARKLCAVARGICRGLSRHFGESIEMEEPSCMLQGGRTCEIIVRKVA